MGSGTSRAEQGGTNDKFLVLDKLTMANGITGTITQRRANGLITFSIVREFERDGVVDWTTFIPEHHIDDYITMLEMVKKRVAELRCDPKVPKLAVVGARR